MGGGQSVPCHDGHAEDDCSVISISDEVVKKLMGGSKGESDAEEGIDELDDHWRRSLKSMDDSHSCRLTLSEAEFYRMVQVVESRFAQLTNTNAACHLPLEKVLKCYKANSKQSLMCAREVREFNACIDINTVEKIKKLTEILCEKDDFDETEQNEKK